jgi:hypothetical protein
MAIVRRRVAASIAARSGARCGIETVIRVSAPVTATCTTCAGAAKAEKAASKNSAIVGPSGQRGIVAVLIMTNQTV